MGKKSHKASKRCSSAPESSKAAGNGKKDMSTVKVNFFCQNFIGRDGRNDPYSGFQSPKIDQTTFVKLKDFERAMSDSEFRDNLVSSIIRKNSEVIIQQHHFLCCNCDNAATDLRVSRADLLERTPPQVLVLIAYPVCSKERCEMVAYQRMEGVFASMEKEDGMKGFHSKSLRGCANCGKSAINLQTCSQCRLGITAAATVRKRTGRSIRRCVKHRMHRRPLLIACRQHARDASSSGR